MICSLLPRHSQDLGHSVRESPLPFHPYVGLSQEGQQNVRPLPLSLRSQRLSAELQWRQRVHFVADASLSDQCGQVPREGLPASLVLRPSATTPRRKIREGKKDPPSFFPSLIFRRGVVAEGLGTRLPPSERSTPADWSAGEPKVQTQYPRARRCRGLASAVLCSFLFTPPR